MIPSRFSLATAQSFADSQRIIKPAELKPLAEHCPGLARFDWSNYLYCSMWRVEKVLKELSEIPAMLFHGRLFDFGAWLGNFSLAAHYAGCKVTAGECWDRYAPALQTQRELLHATGIDTVNIAKFYSESWDAVLLMSVIEHIPHTPRHLLKQVFDTLRPGGYLILDTPNLAYIANRRRLKHGVSPYVPIEEQFFTEIPFEGHNREYTAAEVEWMLTTTGFRVLQTSFYNYSMYGVSFPHLMNARSLLPMMLDPTKRELIFIVARKPDASGLRTTL